MAQPFPKPKRNQPLLDVLAVNNVVLSDFQKLLEGAAKEADEQIPKLIEKHTTTGRIKAAQLALVRRELHALQSALWGELGASLRQGVGQAVEAAADAALDVLVAALDRSGVDTTDLRASLLAQARRGIDAVLAKSANGIPLSRAVYRSQALATGMVDRRVSQGLLLGQNAKTIAKSVRDLIDPNVAGGVSYAANRLARTEINNAYQTAQQRQYEDEPWTTGMRWNLSKSHPRKDVCNLNATRDDHDLGPGVYPVGKRPKSHPNCLCYQTPEQLSEDQFIDAMVSGAYDDYLDKELGLDGRSLSRQVKTPTVPSSRRPAPRARGKDQSEWLASQTRDGYADNAFTKSYEFGDPRDPQLMAVGVQQGFSGLPGFGNVSKEIENGGVELWRGVVGWRGSKAVPAKTAEEIVDQFRSGAYEPGKGIYGNGFYFSVARRVADYYTRPGSHPGIGRGQVFRAVLRKGARVIDYDDLQKKFEEWLAKQDVYSTGELFKNDFQTPPGKTPPSMVQILRDPGLFAAMLGYDAIWVHGKQDGAPYVKGEPGAKNDMGAMFSAHDQYVILNRTALILEVK